VKPILNRQDAKKDSKNSLAISASWRFNLSFSNFQLWVALAVQMNFLRVIRLYFLIEEKRMRSDDAGACALSFFPISLARARRACYAVHLWSILRV
jgi:hypothetical protein